MSGNIQVFVRCRPLVKSELNFPVPVEVYPELHKILVRDAGSDKNTVKTFTYDKVFGPETSQAEIYSEVVAPLVGEVIQGFNCTIFAYGQTGTGKTFTIEGDRTPNLSYKSDDPLSGIIPRSMKHLFKELDGQNNKYDICVSFLELYNEEIFDLLSKSDDFLKLRMFENSSQKGSVIVQGLEIVTVQSMEEVYAILEKGCKRRRKAVTLLNKASSRSHTIFTATVSSRESSETLLKVKSGKLNLVDLAGSENIGRSGAINKRAREAGNINQSLLALGRVITSLCEKASHIPYRESKLTRLLQDSLGGQTKTAVIATISPSSVHIDETLNTLEYALRAKSITNKPELNAHVTVNSIVQDYLQKIDSLRNKIYEAGKNGVYVSEETMRNWESNLAAKREQKFKLLSQLESLSEEDKELDATILELKTRLSEKESQLENAKKRNEEYKIKLKEAKEKHKLHEGMLCVMQPMYDCMHEKYHKTQEERKMLELELNKKRGAVNEVLEEHRKVRASLDAIRSRRKLWNENFHKDTDNLMNDMRNMNDSVNLMTTECKNTIHVLKKGFDSRKSDCTRLFEDVSKGITELEEIGNIFLQNIEVCLPEEKAKNLKRIEDFEKELLSASNVSPFEKLDEIICFCESSLGSLSIAANEWKNEAIFQMENKEKIVTDYENSFKGTLESTFESVKRLMEKQKENMGELTNLVSDSLMEGSFSRQMVLEKFRDAEEAISSLDICCTKINENEVHRTNQAHSYLKNYLEYGTQIVENLSNGVEKADKSLDDIRTEIENEPEVFSAKWENVKTIENSAFSRYKNLAEELEKISKNEDFYPIRDIVRRFTEDIDESNKALEVSKHLQMMADSVLEKGNEFVTRMYEQYTKVEASLSEDKQNMEHLVKSSERLSKTTNAKTSDYFQYLKNNLLERFTRTDCEETIASNDGSFNGTVINESDRTLCLQNNASELPLSDFVPEVECQVCLKNTSEIFKTGDDVSMLSCKDIVKDIIEEPGSSRSSMSSGFGSPIRRPRSKSGTTARKNLKFPDVEKLAQELLDGFSGDEL